MTIPVAGYSTINVEASDENEAINEALDAWEGEADFLEPHAVLSKESVEVYKATAEPAGEDDEDDD